MLRPVNALAAAALLSACQPGGAGLSEVHAAAIRDSIRQVLVEYAETVNRHDIDGALRYFANRPGFHFAEDGRLAYPTYDSLVTAFNIIDSIIPSIEVTWGDIRVTPLGPGTALASAAFHETFQDTAGTVTELNGIATLALRHGPQGWQFVAGHSSTERSPTP